MREINFVVGNLIPYFIFILCIIYFTQNQFAWFDLPLDDAWIHRVYAHSLAFGQGFQYNDAQETGFTSPLWVIVTAPAEWLSVVDVKYTVVAVKVTGCIIGLFTIFYTWKISELVTKSRVVGGLSAAIFALEPRLLFSAFSGMEPVLLVMIMLASFYAVMTDRRLLALILISLAPVTRPEAVIVVPFVILGIALKQGDYRSLRSPAIWLVPAIPFVIWMIFCKINTDAWLPNSYYIKSTPFTLGVEQLVMAYKGITQAGLASTLIFIPGIACFLYVIFKNNKSHMLVISLLLIVIPIVLLFGVVGSRKTMLTGYYWTRWIDPASIIINVPLSIGVAVLLTSYRLNSDKLYTVLCAGASVKKIRLYVFVVATGLLTISLPQYLDTLDNKREHLKRDSRAIRLINVQAGLWINKNTETDATVGANDAGAIRYFGQRKTIDFIGLNNHGIAQRVISLRQAAERLDWMAVSTSWLRKKHPDMMSKESLSERLVLKKIISIEPEEYTVCDCPGQETKMIFKHNKNI